MKDLVMGEKCVLLSLTYMILILLAYHGPNAELLGNIKLKIWQFQNPIMEINAYTFNVLTLLTADLVSAITIGIAIRILCKINVFKILKELQQSFWHVFAIAEAINMVEVNMLNYIGNTNFK